MLEIISIKPNNQYHNNLKIKYFKINKTKELIGQK